MEKSFLSFKNISKTYSGNMVLKNVSFDIMPGEIHGLVGENGAGKSTLMNILFGMPGIHSTGGFEGGVYIEGEQVSVKSPFEAQKLGIGMVHQEFMLIPGFNVTENVKLNREKIKDNLFNKISPRIFGKRFCTLDFKAMGQETRNALDILEMNIDEFAMTRGMPVGHLQFVEIAREIDKSNARLLVLDEPTAVLTEKEAENLLAAVKNLAAKGIAIIFISHRLDEIVSACDSITVLRDGELVAFRKARDTNVKELAGLMVGREIALNRGEGRVNKDAKILLSVKGLEVDMPGEKVRGVDFDVREGEIFGIGGLAGQGKLGIANGVFGTYPARGELKLAGEFLHFNDPESSLKAGIAYVSEDRKGVGLLLDDSIELNIAFTAMQLQNAFLKKFLSFRFLDKKAVRTRALEMINELDIRCSSSLQHTGRLSGGNQQKVCLARALTQKPRLLFVSEPTRGIDIGAKKLILDLLLSLSKEHGLTIVMTSSELAELRSICDRIAIVCEGKIAGVLAPDANDADFGLMMSGLAA